jgi:hypothetical protein
MLNVYKIKEMIVEKERFLKHLEESLEELKFWNEFPSIIVARQTEVDDLRKLIEDKKKEWNLT